MNDIIMPRLEKFQNTYETLNHEYKWTSSYLINSFTSLIYTNSNIQYNHNLFDEMQKFIKNNTGIFSHFRGYDRFFIPALLICRFDAPREAFIKLIKIEEKMHEEKFSRGTYSALASYCMLSCCDEIDINVIIKKAREILLKMKENHFWLTGQDDYPLAVLLSMSDEDINVVVDRTELHYKELHNAGFSRSNSLQFLSHILSFNPTLIEVKVNNCLRIMGYFKEKKLKLSSMQYGTLGAICLIYKDDNSLLDDIIEVYEYLKGLKGIKWSGKDVLLLLSSSIVINSCMDFHKEHSELIEAALGISLQAIIAAQTAAMVASITAASAAATATSSS